MIINNFINCGSYIRGVYHPSLDSRFNAFECFLGRCSIKGFRLGQSIRKYLYECECRRKRDIIYIS